MRCGNTRSDSWQWNYLGEKFLSKSAVESGGVANARFDYVLSIAARCFIADWHLAVSELVRVTRKRFAIGMLNRHSLLWLGTGRHGGSGLSWGLWLSPNELRPGFKGLPVENVRLRRVIYFLSGKCSARLMERLLPDCFTWEGLTVLSGKKARIRDST